jgi:hypothetical protein
MCCTCFCMHVNLENIICVLKDILQKGDVLGHALHGQHKDLICRPLLLVSKCTHVHLKKADISSHF